jgi:hypothetical protein
LEEIKLVQKKAWKTDTKCGLFSFLLKILNRYKIACSRCKIVCENGSILNKIVPKAMNLQKF